MHFQFEVHIFAFSISLSCLTFLHSLFQFLDRISIILWYWWLSFSSSAPCLSAFQWETPVIAKVVMTAYVLVSSLYDWIPPMSPTFSIVPVYHVTVDEDDGLQTNNWSLRFLCSFYLDLHLSHYVTNLFPFLVLSLARN